MATYDIPNSIIILGTKYNIVTDGLYENKTLIKNGGYCDTTSKTIGISVKYNKTSDSVVDNLHSLIQKIFRHELIHALFYEAGLTNYYEDELLVDALSVLLPKIKKYL
jgi:hypothetical protein